MDYCAVKTTVSVSMTIKYRRHHKFNMMTKYLTVKLATNVNLS